MADLLPVFQDLRVPVERISAELLTEDGARHEITLFRAPGQGVESFLEATEPFFPAEEGKSFRLFARSAVVALTVLATPSPNAAEEDLPETRKRVRVQLRGGGAIEGEIHYVAWDHGARPGDFLNQPSFSFPVFTPSSIHHVVKQHVLFVEVLAT